MLEQEQEHSRPDDDIYKKIKEKLFKKNDLKFLN